MGKCYNRYMQLLHVYPNVHVSTNYKTVAIDHIPDLQVSTYVCI